MNALVDLADPAAVTDALSCEWLVACLCAEWCGTCRDYHDSFASMQAQFPQAAFLWVDIETHADWADDMDIENFPTIMIQQDDAVRFLGTMLPYPGHLQRTLETLLNASGDARRPGESVPLDLRELLRMQAG
ncbi:thioredoxin family protein [Denitromonas halophila]|uniref:Thioredoxin family protein n=1 Tax=Denitromonas halophila TaxID=1629404 RepID=A0A557QJN7_9RHOO|nr:thioredoxin family protein [Denitromonas halophila]TVO53126.1 thioredoxin family protein [Denitromonas halophila]